MIIHLESITKGHLPQGSLAGASPFCQNIYFQVKDITKSPLIRHPVGTGPYRFKKWISGQKVFLEYNSNHFEGRPYINWYTSRNLLIKGDLKPLFLS